MPIPNLSRVRLRAPPFARGFGTIAREVDVAVIGGGIIGCGTARELLERRPGLRVAVVEKEDDIALHQTSHNSGVIHAGMYYKPGSLKARFCVAGMKKMYKFCREKGIAHRKTGKLIVAVREDERAVLNSIFTKGQQNGVPGLEMLDAKQIKEIEPNAAGVEAIWSPETGIVDFAKVCQAYAQDVEAMGGEIILNFDVKRIDAVGSRGVVLEEREGSESGRRSVMAKRVITCAGLQSDYVARSGGGGSQNPMIAPFRGAWLTVKDEYVDMVKTNIYPVPDPRLPFLGVHITPTMNNELLLGPNATLAFQREGYRYRDINIAETLRTLAHPGMLKIARKHMVTGMHEIYRDFITSANLGRLQKYIPSLTGDHIKGWKCGVRAIAIDQNGILDEFIIEEGVPGRVMHVRNAPSPACTASLQIAEEVVNKAEHFGFFSG
ncbi:hypothetical protein AAMO2058_000485600 [Amorphochlora amoebiformis]